MLATSSPDLQRGCIDNLTVEPALGALGALAQIVLNDAIVSSVVARWLRQKLRETLADRFRRRIRQKLADRLKDRVIERVQDRLKDRMRERLTPQRFMDVSMRA